LQYKDKFYYEYQHDPKLLFSNKTLVYKTKLQCVDKFVMNKTENFVIGELAMGIDGNKLKSLLKDEKVFDYYHENEHVTILNEPNMNIVYRVFDMNTLTQGVTISIPISAEVFKGEEFEFYINLEEYENKLERLKTADRLFYEISFNKANEDILLLTYQGTLDYQTKVVNETAGIKLALYILITLSVFVLLSLLILLYSLFRKSKKIHSDNLQNKLIK
jgi:hypothetical protein